jgi:hypothetical protein
MRIAYWSLPVRNCAMRGRAVLVFLAAFVVVERGTARIAERSWTYQEMFEKSDFVVIATGIATKDTAERSKLLETIDVIGVETQFKTCVVLKGKNDRRNFVLHHYRMPDDKFVNDGPLLLEVLPGKHQTFLMFLVAEKNERYAPVTGQTDPAGLSVLKLHGGADPGDL